MKEKIKRYCYRSMKIGDAILVCLPTFTIGALVITIGIYCVCSADPNGHEPVSLILLTCTVIGLAFLLVGFFALRKHVLVHVSEFRKAWEAAESSGQIKMVEDDFENGTKLFGDKVRMGTNYIIGSLPKLQPVNTITAFQREVHVVYHEGPYKTEY